MGWRIDYHLATPALAETICAASVYLEQWFSDHAPLTIDYDLKSEPPARREQAALRPAIEPIGRAVFILK